MQSTTGGHGPAVPVSTPVSARGFMHHTQPAIRHLRAIDQLARLPLVEELQANAFLDGMARGEHHPAVAQAVFNALITHEAYELLVEAFSAFQHLARAQAQANDQPYGSKLCLQLPNGWKPRAPAAMAAAFAQVQVDRLEVLPGPCRENPWEGHAHEPVCAEVCEAIQALLKSGTRELGLHVALAKVDVVGKAIGESRQLEWLSLGHRQANGPMDQDSLVCYTHVIHLGVLECPSLRRVEIDCDEVALMLQLSLEESNVEVVPWTSLKLRYASDDLTYALRLFSGLNGFMGCMPNLKAFDLAVRGLGTQHRAHAKIIAWDVCASKGLRRLACDVGPLTHSAAATMHALKASDPELLKQAASIRIAFQGGQTEFGENVLPYPACELEELVMKGFAWSAEELGALSRALAKNETLQWLDLSDGGLDSRAMAEMVRALPKDTHLKTFKVPQDPGSYYEMLADESFVESLPSAGFAPGDVQAALDRRRSHALLQSTTARAASMAGATTTTTGTTTATATSTATTTTTAAARQDTASSSADV